MRYALTHEAQIPRPASPEIALEFEQLAVLVEAIWGWPGPLAVPQVSMRDHEIMEASCISVGASVGK